MIGIIGALELEVQTLITRLENPVCRSISGRQFFSGTLCGKSVVIVQCGIGKVNAAMCAQTMILEYRPILIVNVGVAGSLSDDLSIGDIVVARDLVQWDVDTSAIGDPVGLVSTVNRIAFPCAEWATEKILQCIEELDGLHGCAARIASGDQFVADAATKKRIRDTFHARACEMEGCPIAQVCLINGVECAVIRTISDSTDSEHAMEYDRFCEMAARISSDVLTAFLEEAPNKL